jgi:hypothetical protein
MTRYIIAQSYERDVHLFTASTEKGAKDDVLPLDTIKLSGRLRDNVSYR